ncbi:MAG: hypothetical protein COA42_03245 [Alteromonadaceae bacterium]|nr:MAG: hypothetical protein COA42_03245 [Alteromonadaceae bacterium]
MHIIPHQILNWLSALASIVLLSTLIISPAIHANTLPKSVDTSTLVLPEVPEVDLLALDDKIKELLDTHIRPIERKSARVEQLHQLLFDSQYLNIGYEFSATKTAQQTFDDRNGNCLSHASLFVAAARYVGLKARFQLVEVDRQWEKEDNYYIVPGHVNAFVNLPGGATATVEFVDSYVSKELSPKTMPDELAQAEYYSNVAMEHLSSGDKLKALAYLKKAVKTYKKQHAIWSNLGVVYKFLGDYDRAEIAYMKAYKLNKRDPSLITNIYILYTQQGKTELAAKYEKRVSRYLKRNPYKLNQMASINIASNDLKTAERLYKKAIHIKPEEHSFHFDLARLYFKQKKYNLAEKYFQSANKAATERGQPSLYKKKLDHFYKSRDRYQVNL